jgi:hypothetical protein
MISIHTPNKYVIIVWQHVAGLRSHHDRLHRQVVLTGFADAKIAQKHLREEYPRAQVEIYHSPEPSVMLLKPS